MIDTMDNPAIIKVLLYCFFMYDLFVFIDCTLIVAYMLKKARAFSDFEKLDYVATEFTSE